jgi:cell division septum initiation protein DivIVA
MAVENYSVLLKAITATEPTFNVTLRGYDRRQVDQYAHTTETQLANALAESNRLGAKVRALTEDLVAVQEELTELRRRPAITEKASFRHLGLRVEQILSEAEQQAEEVRVEANDEASQLRARLAEEVTRIRATLADEVAHGRERLAEEVAVQRDRLAIEDREVREEHARERHEIEEARQACAQAERQAAQRAEIARAEVARAEADLDRLKVASHQLIAAAQAEYERVTTSAMENAERIHADLATKSRALREEAYEEANRVTMAAEAYAEAIIGEADQHATELRELTEGYAARMRAHVPPVAGQINGKHPKTSKRAISDRPDSEVSDSEVPDSDVPDSEVPDSEVPDSEVPDSEVQDSDVPDSDVRDEAFEADTPGDQPDVDSPIAAASA